MEEIKALHSLNLEWGCITNLVDKISNIEDSIEGGWPQLIDMVADAMTEEAGNKDPVSAFFHLYSFLFHLYYRIKANPTPRKFNEFTKEEDRFWIKDYNYEMFCWAINHGYTKEIDNLIIQIPFDLLDEKQRRAMERRCIK